MPPADEPRVTVITPVYNGAAHLAECIRSVLEQTYQNWEYIVVDNCSTDATPSIMQQFAREDPRIRVYRNDTFVSALENHDIAFRRMSPESVYCKVVQADDWIFPECLERMVEVAEANGSVGVVGAYRLEEEVVTLDGLSFPSTFVSGREICRRTLLGDFYVFGTPTSLLLRSDLVRGRDPFYDEIRYPNHCDTAVCYELLRNSDFGFVHQVLTFTRRPPEGRTAYALQIASSSPEHLMMIQQYGRIYLDQSEFERLLREKTRSYYRLLGTQAFRRPGREFWMHHRAALDGLGLPSSRLRLLRASLEAIFEALSKPFRSLRTVMSGSPE